MANKSGAAQLAPAPEDDTDDNVVDLNSAKVILEWEGLRFEVPKRRGRWPARSVREFNRGRNVEGLVLVLGGEEQWALIEARCPLADDVDDFISYATATLNRECVP